MPTQPAEQCKCGYDLRGLPQAARVCPECGADLPLPQRLRPLAPQWAVSAARIVGEFGWVAVLCAVLSMVPHIISLVRSGEPESALMLLGCPGIPALIACLAVLPWYSVRRRLKHQPTNGDCMFVALIPWVALIFVGVPVLAIHLSNA